MHIDVRGRQAVVISPLPAAVEHEGAYGHKEYADSGPDGDPYYSARWQATVT